MIIRYQIIKHVSQTFTVLNNLVNKLAYNINTIYINSIKKIELNVSQFLPYFFDICYESN